MNSEKLKSLVEKITREVIKDFNKSALQAKRALFIFCDSSAYEAYVDQLIDLKNHGIENDMLFLDGETSAWLGIHQIQSTGTKQVIASDEYAPAPLELPKLYDIIAVPEIDLDNAARISQGLKGSVKAEVVLAALMLNIPVVINENCIGIKRADRRTLGVLALPGPYRKKFNLYIHELKELGIHFAEEKNLHERIKELLNAASQSTNQVDYEGKVLSVPWLAKNLSKGQKLSIKKDTIITPLARDYLKEKKIKLNINRG